MHEKFLNLPKGMRLLVLFAVYLITIGGFGGCLLVRYYASIMWLEIVLTCVGMFFSVVAICLTIYHIFSKDVKKNL